MCVVSMIGDHFHDKWNTPYNQNIIKEIEIWRNSNFPKPNVTREEFDNLKKEVLDMKELLKKAFDYDKKNNEPNCEIEEKIATLKRVANLFGIDINTILKE